MLRPARLAALVRRFLVSLREEGARMALHKARMYLTLKWHGWAPSVLGGRPGHGPQAPEAYLHGIWSDMARGGGFHVPRPAVTTPRIALIGDLNLPQCRKYRVEQLAQLLRAQGMICDYAHYQDIPRATDMLQGATHLMEYRLQVMPLTSMYRYEARRLGLPVLYDIDDPLFSVSAYETYSNMDNVEPALKAHFLSEAPKYAEMMNGADLVSVSTPALAAHARAYCPRPVYVRRNFADAETLENGAQAMSRAGGARDGLFRLVFASGSQGHEADFALIGDVVAAFVTADPNRRLTILGHFDESHLPEALAAQTDLHPFVPYERYLSLLARSDLALMPLADEIFNRGKSAVRVMDAASVGVACVVSPVGDQVEMIDPGQTGFVARTPEEWKTAFETLAADPARARAMGQAARTALETQWNGQPAPHIIAPEILAWLRQ